MHEIAGTGARDDRHQNHHRLGFFLGLARRVVHEHVFRPAGGRGLHGRDGHYSRVRSEPAVARAVAGQAGRMQRPAGEEARAARVRRAGHGGLAAAPACRHQPQLDRARRRRNLRRRVHGSLPAGMGRCVLPRRRAERDALRGRRLRLRHRRRRAASVHDTRGRRRVLGAAAPRLGRVVREHRPPVAHVPPHRPRRPAAEAERPLAPESAPRNLDDAVVRRGPRHDRVRLPAAPRFVLAYRQRRLSQRHPRASRARRHGGARVRHRRVGTAPGKRGVPWGSWP